MIESCDINITEFFKSNIVSQNKDVLQKFLEDPQFKDQVVENGMDLLSIICENIEEKMIDFNNSDNVYSNLINFIVQNGSAKEVICILNVHLDKVNNDFKFLILLYPLSVALQRLDLSSISSKVILKDSLQCAIAYFKSLPVAHYKGLEGEELEVYVQTTETQRFLRLSKAYLGFLESFMRNSDFLQSNDIKNEILRNILVLFDCSLIKLGFYSPGIVAEECRLCGLRAFHLVEKLVKCLHEFIIDINIANSKIKLGILNSTDSDTQEELANEIIPYTSLVSLLYHVFVRQHFGRFPQIFLPIYNWSFCLPILSICLQESTDPHVIRICLQLLEEFDPLIEDSSVIWKKSLHIELFVSLKIASTSNFNREIRGFAYNMFVKTFNKLTVKGRFKLLKSLLKTVDHFGFKGQLILLLKKEIVSEISRKRMAEKYFLGSSVYPLLADIFSLPDGDKTDIVNESEWILAALNMLYVLVQRDDQHHRVGMDVLIRDFEKEFLQPLTKATELSLGQYMNEKKLIETDDNLSTITELNADLAFMDKAHKIDFVDKAILMIELIRCNISRLTNVI